MRGLLDLHGTVVALEHLSTSLASLRVDYPEESFAQAQGYLRRSGACTSIAALISTHLYR
jgi:hypothetical protein